jgi:hypothetical protein
MGDKWLVAVLLPLGRLVSVLSGTDDGPEHGCRRHRKARHKLAGISYDKPEIQKTFIERRDIHYTLLSDPKSEIIDRYKLRDPQYPPGNLAYGVPAADNLLLGQERRHQGELYEDTYQNVRRRSWCSRRSTSSRPEPRHAGQFH